MLISQCLARQQLTMYGQLFHDTHGICFSFFFILWRYPAVHFTACFILVLTATNCIRIQLGCCNSGFATYSAQPLRAHQQYTQ